MHFSRLSLRPCLRVRDNGCTFSGVTIVLPAGNTREFSPAVDGVAEDGVKGRIAARYAWARPLSMFFSLLRVAILVQKAKKFPLEVYYIMNRDTRRISSANLSHCRPICEGSVVFPRR